MSTRYDNSSDLTNVIYDGTELDKVVYNDTIVYQRITVNYYCENSVYRSVKVITGSSVSLASSNAASKSGWSFIGWRLDKTANGTVQSSITAGTSTINLYAVYRQSITVSYNGNGATSGSTASQSGYRYYNNGNISNPSFTLRSNSFSRTNYRFVNWRMGSTSGTAYNAGSSVTLSNNTTFYAAWQANYSQSVATINGYAAYLYSQGVIPFMTVPNYGSAYKLNTSSITGNTLKLKGNYTSVIANISCNISISVNLSCSAIDTFAWYLYYVAVYKNGSHVVDLLYKGYDTSYTDSNRYQNCISTYNISANAGDTIEVRVQGGVNGSGNTRTQYSGTVTFTGTPNL